MPASLAVKELWYGNKDGRFIGVGGGDAKGDRTEWRPKVLLLLLLLEI